MYIFIVEVLFVLKYVFVFILEFRNKIQEKKAKYFYFITK